MIMFIAPDRNVALNNSNSFGILQELEMDDYSDIDDMNETGKVCLWVCFVL